MKTCLDARIQLLSERKLVLFCCVCVRLLWSDLQGEIKNTIIAIENRLDGKLAKKALTRILNNIAKRKHTPLSRFVGVLGRTAQSFPHNQLPPISTNLLHTLIHLLQEAKKDISLDALLTDFETPAIVKIQDIQIDNTIVQVLAEAAYETRNSTSGVLEHNQFLVLHDALLDVSCDSKKLLTHLQQATPHYRGCWALDLLLRKKNV